MDFLEYKKFLIEHYPSVSLFKGEEKTLFFPETLSFPSQSFESAKKVVETLFSLKKNARYLEDVLKEAPSVVPYSSLQDSVLMAYDFHIDEQGEPRLIEVNTNASGFLLVNSFMQFQGLDYKASLDSLKNSFQAEWMSFCEMTGNSSSQPQKVVLIDEKPMEQKMYLEFLMFKDFFQSFGWSLEICDSSSLQWSDEQGLLTSEGQKVDFIYNRSTDFYFNNHPHLLKAYQEQACCITPHPREYFLLSDKNRLCDWSLDAGKSWPSLKQIEKYLLFSSHLSKENEQEAWANKKKYFFKSTKGYGGKMVYRGTDLTRKKFALLLENSSLFQENIPPSLWVDAQGEKWKVDFRFFVYRDQIQQITARCYKGQLTNFRDEGSGFSLVECS